MKYNENDLLCYEGAGLRKTDQGKLLQQKTLKELLNDKFHLYGFLLAILTADVSIFQFVCSAEGPCLPTLEDIHVLIQVCQDIQWKEGILSLLCSKYTKDQFILAPFSDKIDFAVNVLNESMLKAMFVDSEIKPDNMDIIKRQQDSYMQEVSQVMYQYPYIFVTWSMKDLLQQDEQEFASFIREVQLNINTTCQTVLESTNQLCQVLEILNVRHFIIEPLNSEKKLTEKEIKKHS